MGFYEKRDHLGENRRRRKGKLGLSGCAGLLGAGFVFLLLIIPVVTNSPDESTSIASYSIELSTPDITQEESFQQATALPTATRIAEEIVSKAPSPTSDPTTTPTPHPTSTKSLSASLIRESRLASPSPTMPVLTVTPETINSVEAFGRDMLKPTPNGTFSPTLKVPILMYHYVSIPPPDADIYRRDLSVTPEMFRNQLSYLVEAGYSTIDLYDLSMAVVDKKPLPEKPVILTFDDGYLDNYQNAFPLLQEFDLTATFFIATGFIDAGNPNYMDWQMLDQLAKAGMSIEPHSKNHIDLRDRERDVLLYEILGSQETIAAHTGYIPRFFAYPSGRYDIGTIDILEELDFWGALTTNGGTWHSFDTRYEWTRQRVRFDTSLPLFADLVD